MPNQSDQPAPDLRRCPVPSFTPPRSDHVERVASALAFTLFLSSWLVAYVGACPPDPSPVRHVAFADARR